jgi:hypothetical protein
VSIAYKCAPHHQAPTPAEEVPTLSRSVVRDDDAVENRLGRRWQCDWKWLATLSVKK